LTDRPGEEEDHRSMGRRDWAVKSRRMEAKKKVLLLPNEWNINELMMIWGYLWGNLFWEKGENEFSIFIFYCAKMLLPILYHLKKSNHQVPDSSFVRERKALDRFAKRFSTPN
jgi:hypothetical protein